MTSLSTTTLSWLLTYAVHSTVLLGLARLVSRRPISASARDVLWKTALAGGIITASVQVGFGIRPMGSLALPTASAHADAAPARSAAGSNKAAATVAARTATPRSQSVEGMQTGVTAVPPAAAVFADSARVAALIVTAWLAIAILLLAVYAARRMILVGRLGDRRLVSDGRLASILATLAPRSGAGRVTLTSSATISSPVALGLREICVPAAALTELDEDQQRGLLAHELAHLARRDPAWLDVAGVIERVFFFQPLNRIARREMQVAAEFLCDDWAATRLGSGVPLAKCLANVAEWIQASPLGVPVAGMAEQRSLLLDRIARLDETGAHRQAAPRAVLTGAAVVLLAAIGAAAPGVTQRGPATAVTAHIAFQDPAAVISMDSAAAEPDPAVIAALIERLKDSDAGVRRAAASSLGNLQSKRATLPLIALLSDRDREVRVAAAHALGNIHDPRAINSLLELLRDPVVPVRHAALEALDNFEHEDIVPGPILPALTDANADVRHRAAHLLGSIGDRAAVGPLLNALRDASADVRSAAAQALGEIKDASAANGLTAALKDGEADVRHAAIQALVELKVAVSEAALVDLLGDASADVRQSVIEIVRERPFPGAIAALVKLLDDTSSDVRVEAVSALGEIRDPAAKRAVRAALSSRDPKVRARAAEVLGERP